MSHYLLKWADIKSRETSVHVLFRYLIDTKCHDRELLRLADRIARRTFHDLHPAWIRWGYYMEVEMDMGPSAYNAWAEENCR